MKSKLLAFFAIFSFWDKSPEIKMGIPDGCFVKKDTLLDLDLSYCGLLFLNNKPKKIKGIELPGIMENFTPLGARGCDYYYSNPNIIPDEFKGKDNLFMGTIYEDELGRLWVPNLYFLPMHEVWHRSFCCLSEVLDSNNYHFPILVQKINHLTNK
jgi:hypothetical protein